MIKNILITTAVIGAIALGVYAYFVLFQKPLALPTFQFRAFPPTGELPSTTAPGEVAQPLKKRGEVSVLVSEPTIAPALAREGTGILYFLRETGNVYRINFDGKEKTRLSNITIIGIYDALWSPDRSKAFITYERTGDVKKIIFDLSTDPPTSSALSNSIHSLSWSPDGKISYLSEELTSGIRLITANALGRLGKETLRIPLADLILLPNTGTNLFFSQPASAFAQIPLFQLNQKTGAFKEVKKGFGFTALVSPKGERIVFAVANPISLEALPLQVLAVKDGAEQPLTIKTMPEKCVWKDENSIFCAIPKNSLSEIAFPDDYYKGLISTNDQLVKIDIPTGTVTAYEDLRGFDMRDLIVDARGENVFFRDAKTDFLYRFLLP